MMAFIKAKVSCQLAKCERKCHNELKGNNDWGNFITKTEQKSFYNKDITTLKIGNSQ